MFETLEAPASRFDVLKRAFVALPRVGVGVMFLAIGYAKLDDDPRSMWVQIFAEIGIGQWFRYVAAVIQMTGGVLMLFRRTLIAGAVLLACTMLGAVYVDLFILGTIAFILPVLLLMAIGAAWWMSG